MVDTKNLDPKFNPFKPRPKKETQIKKMVAVVSGKGGVGKSTVSALLATHAQRAGYQTGIIDGDIIECDIGIVGIVLNTGTRPFSADSHTFCSQLTRSRLETNAVC